MKKFIALTTLALTTLSSQAEVRINGFANLIGGLTSSDDTLYGYTDNVSFSPESLFAIQISGDVNSKVTATGQLVARGIDDYDPQFEWAYMTYSANQNFSVSAGRLRLPLFNYSASKDVGYSYHWVAAPEAVYNVPFNNLDGIRADYATFAGDWEYNLSLSLGTFSGDAFGSSIKGENVAVLSAEATYEWFKIRAVAGSGKTTIELANSSRTDVAQLGEGLGLMSQFGFAGLASDLALQDDTGRFLGLSAQIDKFDWFVNAEVTSVDVADSFLAKTVAYYVTAGVRQGAWLPSLTYEKSKTDDELKFQDQIGQIATSGLQPEQILILTTVAIGSQRFTQSEYSVVTASLRYDYDTNIALKVDLSKYSNDLDDSADATLMRFAVNYVF